MLRVRFGLALLLVIGLAGCAAPPDPEPAAFAEAVADFEQENRDNADLLAAMPPPIVALEPELLAKPYWYCSVDWWCNDVADHDQGTGEAGSTAQAAACLRAWAAARNRGGEMCLSSDKGIGYRPRHQPDCHCAEETVLAALAEQLPAN